MRSGRITSGPPNLRRRVAADDGTGLRAGPAVGVAVPGWRDRRGAVSRNRGACRRLCRLRTTVPVPTPAAGARGNEVPRRPYPDGVEEEAIPTSGLDFSH